MRLEAAEPPASALLDQMGVPAIGQHLLRRSGMDRQESQLFRDRGDFGQDGVERLRLICSSTSMQVTRSDGTRLAIFRKGGIIGPILDPTTVPKAKSLLQIALAGAIVGQARAIAEPKQRPHDRRERKRRDTISGVLVQLLLLCPIFLGNCRAVIAAASCPLGSTKSIQSRPGAERRTALRGASAAAEGARRRSPASSA